jgi:hypothetical protein
MSPKDLKKLIKTMRANGITHYKTSELELSLGPEPLIKAKQLSEKEEQEIKHKLEEMTSIMQLDDENLLKRLFPDHQKYPDSEDLTQ